MRIIIVIIFFTLGIPCTNAQTRIAVTGGFNYSTARAYYNDIKQPVGYVPGGNLGIQVKTAFEGMLHFSPLIAYQSRGAIIKSVTNADRKQISMHYISIAPMLSIDKHAGGKNSIVISAGPVAAFAIGGTEKTTINGLSTSSRMKFSTTGDYGLFDLGLQASAGYHFRHFFIEAGYYYGLANINNNVERDKRNIRNRSLSLNLGYYLKSYL